MAQNSPNTPSSIYQLVAAEFNLPVTEMLVAGATGELIANKVAADNINCLWVPGAFELPQACKKLIKANQFPVYDKHQAGPSNPIIKNKLAAVIALGAVIRGETSHFDFVAAEVARGIAKVNLQFDIPVIFGVLTCDTATQAQERADPDKKNIGEAAARAAIKMANLYAQL